MCAFFIALFVFFQLVVISVDKCIGKRTHKKLDRSTEG